MAATIGLSVSPLLEMRLAPCGHHGSFRLKISIFMERTVALPQRPTAPEDGGRRGLGELPGNSCTADRPARVDVHLAPLAGAARGEETLMCPEMM
jgi:hypothetical protein